MNVSNLNSVAFTARTKDGNDYKKTHMGLKTGVAVGAAAMPAYIFAAHLDSTTFKKAVKSTFKILTTDVARVFKDSKKEGFKIIGIAAGITAVVAGIGAIYDSVGNKKMAKNVDNAVANVIAE